MKKAMVMCWMLMFITGFGVVESSAIVLDFEDLEQIIWSDPYYTNHPHDGETAVMPTGYAGIDFLNFYWNDARQDDDSGYAYGSASGHFSIYNSGGSPAELHADSFYFEGAYFTSAWNQDLNLTLSGFYQGQPSWERMVVCDATRPTWFDFSDTGLVDQINFSSFGGTPYWSETSAYHFIMDDVTMSPVPEPATILLLATGFMGLLGIGQSRKSKH